MEEILEKVSCSSLTPDEKKQSFQLLIKIFQNILNNNGNVDPLLHSKYRWVKAGIGTVLQERILNQPFFPDILENAGFIPIYGRPPHQPERDAQQYQVLKDDINLTELQYKLEMLEAVYESILIDSDTITELPSSDASCSTNSTPVDRSKCAEAKATTECRLNKPSTCNDGLQELRLQQRQRYEQQRNRDGISSCSSATENANTNHSQAHQNQGTWWWKNSWFGGDGDSSDSRNNGPNSRPRHMTLRDLPQPKPRGG